MSLFRSSPMKYYQLYIPTEEAYNVVSKVAPQTFVQFLDAASNNFHKPYYNDVRRCQDVIAKIDHIIRQVKKYEQILPEMPDIKEIFRWQKKAIESRKITEQALMNQIEHQIDINYAAIDQSIRSIENSQRKILDLEDYKYLLFKARQIFSTKSQKLEKETQQIDFSRTTLEQLRLVNISGVLSAKDMFKFEKMIFRATKGHSILYTFNIPNDSVEIFGPHFQVQSRTAFIIIIESGTNILNKVNRICESFSTKKYTLQTNKEQIFEKIKEIEDAINDTKQLCAMTQKKLQQDLQVAISVSDYGYSKFQTFRILLQKQVIIFNTLNLLSTDHYGGKQGSTMIAKVWVPQDKKGLLFALMPPVVTVRQPETHYKPPTHFQINQFTMPFQEIVDTYGIPRYSEVNPALFAIAIFPFLFGVMFGDIGHGGIVLAFGIWLCVDQRAAKFLPGIYPIRYLVLTMGINAFYSGWIYNEFFSIPLNVFGSCYGHAAPEEDAQKIEGCVYPLGMDPKWIRAENQLNYFNSYKMKFAVIIGVTQMTLGIFLKMLNNLHWKNYIDLIFEWLPQQVFFFCTFGYMCLLIIGKWSMPWGIERDTSQAPSIIAQMIALPLKLGSTQGKPLWDLQFQQSMQFYLLMTALVCVPWMLIFKPLILWTRMPAAPKHEEVISSASDLNENLNPLDEDVAPQAVTPHKEEPHASHEEHDISEIAVHQIIETIEFVLGSISNTASYLRLWALSLAHGQLARVFLEKTIGAGIIGANALIIIIGMYFFVSITVGVIMAMDSMECFLHALRLQWVQFNSKFFKADGRKFMPITFYEPILKSVQAYRTEE